MLSPSLQVLLFDALAPVYGCQRAFHQDPAVSRPQISTSHAESRVKDSMRRSRPPCAPNRKIREGSDQSDPDIECKYYAKTLQQRRVTIPRRTRQQLREGTQNKRPRRAKHGGKTLRRAKPGPHLVSETDQSLCTTTDLNGERVKAQTHRAQPVRYVSPQATVQQRPCCDRNGVIGKGGGGTALPR